MKMTHDFNTTKPYPLTTFPLSTFLDFYLMQSVQAEIHASTLHEVRHSAAKLRQDVDEYMDYLAETMKNALHDYIFLASFGEARYAATRFVSHPVGVPLGGHRTRAYRVAMRYNPAESYQLLCAMFNSTEWGNGKSVGGAKWGNVICSLDLLYHKRFPAAAFVDYCADLRHNGGLIFDKPTVLEHDYDYLPTLLDDKRVAISFVEHALKCQRIEMEYVHPSYICYKTASMVNRYFVVYQRREDKHMTGTKGIPEYTPVSWGSMILSEVDPELKNHGACEHCDSVDYFPAMGWDDNEDLLCQACHDEYRQEREGYTARRERRQRREASGAIALSESLFDFFVQVKVKTALEQAIAENHIPKKSIVFGQATFTKEGEVIIDLAYTVDKELKSIQHKYVTVNPFQD